WMSTGDCFMPTSTKGSPPPQVACGKDSVPHASGPVGPAGSWFQGAVPSDAAALHASALAASRPATRQPVDFVIDRSPACFPIAGLYANRDHWHPEPAGGSLCL